MAAFGWLTAISALVSACGSSAPSQGARYEQIVRPADAAWAAFVAQARTWPGGAIPASGTALTHDVVMTWERVNRELLARTWPGPAQGDVAALVRVDNSVYQTLERRPVPDGTRAWWTSLIKRFSAEQAVAGLVRLDLHLPLAPQPARLSGADSGAGEPALVGGPPPGQAQAGGEGPGQPELDVAGDGQPGPPVRCC